jgi:Fe-S-cluster containining protein
MTDCNRCGDCCEHLRLNVTKSRMRTFLAERHRWSDTPEAIEHEANARFILEHWHRSGGGGRATVYDCDAFDRTSRLCTAHQDRPPICAGYPWYGDEPGVRTPRLSPHCSFNLDVGVPVQIR